MFNELRNIFIIGKYTFYEVLKSRILLNVFFLGVGLLLFSYAATEFTYGTPRKVAMDFGMGALSFSAIGIAIFIGVNIINKEIESRTIYIILSQPLKRVSFLIGRILGMSFLLALNILILSVLTLIIYFVFGGEFQSLIIWSIVFALIEAVLILNIAVFFSLVTNVTMSVIYTIVLFISGHAIVNLIEITSKPVYATSNAIAKFLSIFIPNLSKLNIKQFILYNSNLEASYLFSALGYGVFYTLIIMFISVVVFNKKQLN